MQSKIFFIVVAGLVLILFGSFFLLPSQQTIQAEKAGEENNTQTPSEAASEEGSVKSADPEKKNTTLSDESGDLLPKDFLQPHKALYDIEMVSSSSGAQIANISGTMFYEVKLSCDAWITDHKFNLLYEYTDSPAMQISSDFTTWESLDGKTFNFTSRRSRNGELYEEIRGFAERKEDGTGVATYTMPEELIFDLPKGFVFPMQHNLDVLSYVKEGRPEQRFINRILFDGSDLEGPVEVNAFIGEKANAMAVIEVTPKIDVTLLNSYARNLRLAFFPLHLGDQPDADYEMNAMLHRNSVISDMFIDYGEFSVTQKLVALEAVEPSQNCEQD